MTLDEAIKHCKEKAEKKRKDYEQACAYNIPSEGCLKCAEEHEQLAEWLEDYKRLLEETPHDNRTERALLIIDRLYTEGHINNMEQGVLRRCILFSEKGGAEE